MENYILFFRPYNKYGEFSNWYKSDFVSEGITFHSTEQYLMYKKAMLFNDTEVAQEVLASTNEGQIKKLGRKVRNYNDSVWSQERFNIMVDGLIGKFSQNNTLKELLLNTGNSIIVECSPYDRIWGVGISVDDAEQGKEFRGDNLLGKALMQARDYIRNHT